MSTMEQIIRKNMKNGALVYAGEFKTLANSSHSWHHFNRPYFFFQQELDISSVSDEKEYQHVKNQLIRHLVPYGNVYYDYIVGKEYSTLAEWARDNSWSVTDIRYGVVKKHRNYVNDPVVAYITLDTLVKHLDPNYKGDHVVEVTDKQKLLSQFDFLLKQIVDIRAKIESM